MKQWCEKHWLLCCILGFIVLTFIIPMLINGAYEIDKGYMTIWGAPETLSYYGEIVGGIGSLLAVVIAVKHFHSQREKDIADAESARQQDINRFEEEKRHDKSLLQAEIENLRQQAYEQRDFDREIEMWRYNKEKNRERVMYAKVNLSNALHTLEVIRIVLQQFDVSNPDATINYLQHNIVEIKRLELISMIFDAEQKEILSDELNAISMFAKDFSTLVSELASTYLTYLEDKGDTLLQTSFDIKKKIVVFSNERYNDMVDSVIKGIENLEKYYENQLCEPA